MNELDILLQEIRDLCELPEFQKSLHYKVDELKFNLSTWIGDYREIECMIHDKPGTKKPGASKKINGHMFALSRLGKKLWIPSLPGFSKVDGYDLFELYAVVPREIIDFIVNYGAKKGLPVMRRGLTLAGLEGRKFDLVFEKHNSKYYTGMVHEHGGVKRIVRCKSPDGMQNLDPGDLKLLITYFKNHPHYFQQVFTGFQKTWKPMLDKLSRAAM
jgi:hypothetical protein